MSSKASWCSSGPLQVSMPGFRALWAGDPESAHMLCLHTASCPELTRRSMLGSVSWGSHNCYPTRGLFGHGIAVSLYTVPSGWVMGQPLPLALYLFFPSPSSGWRWNEAATSDGGRDDQFYESTCKVSRVLKKASTFCPSVALKESERKERSLWWPTRLNCKARQYGD